MRTLTFLFLIADSLGALLVTDNTSKKPAKVQGLNVYQLISVRCAILEIFYEVKSKRRSKRFKKPRRALSNHLLPIDSRTVLFEGDLLSIRCV